MKKAIVLLVVLLAVAIAACWWLSGAERVTHRELRAVVGQEGEAVRARVDARCDALEKKVDAANAKLDRIEAKLDRIIEMATPKLPDGMKVAE